MAETWKKLAFFDEVATTFLGLSDTPGAYATPGAYYKVNAGGDAVEEGDTLATIQDHAPKAHLLGAHTTDTLANLNAIVTDATLIDGGDAVLDADFVAKGDLMGASAPSTPAVLTVGTDGKILRALASETPGLVWGDLRLDEAIDPTAAVGFAGQQAEDLVVHSVASAAARPTPVVAKICHQQDDDHLYICTVAV